MHFYSSQLITFLCSYQEQYKLEAMRGLGIDRHFFGLYLIAKELDIKPFPKLFEHMVKFLLLTIKYVTSIVCAVMASPIYNCYISNTNQADKILQIWEDWGSRRFQHCDKPRLWYFIHCTWRRYRYDDRYINSFYSL